MGLHAEEDHIRRPSLLEIADDAGMRFEIAVRADDAQPTLLHRPQVRAPGEQGNVKTGARQAGSQISPDGPGAGDQKLHCPPVRALATAPRWILPVAVRGMVSTTYSFFGI